MGPQPNFPPELTKRRPRLLVILGQNPEGISLPEVVGALGETGRKAHAATVTMLLNMRQSGHVAYEEPERGTRGGLYNLTGKGREALREITGETDVASLEASAPAAEGAMRRDRATVLRSRAEHGQAPADIPSSVFALGRMVVGGGQP